MNNNINDRIFDFAKSGPGGFSCGCYSQSKTIVRARRPTFGLQGLGQVKQNHLGYCPTGSLERARCREWIPYISWFGDTNTAISKALILVCLLLCSVGQKKRKEIVFPWKNHKNIPHFRVVVLQFCEATVSPTNQWCTVGSSLWYKYHYC